MIVFDLVCDHGHQFEGWFRSSSDFEAQAERGLVDCPHCGSVGVLKAPMAPSVGAKGNTKSEASSAPSREPAPEQREAAPMSNAPIPADVHKAMAALAKAQEQALQSSTWVGKDFAEQSRKMHYGEIDHSAIHGQASVEDAQALVEEGVPVAPLSFPVAPPDELN